MSLTVWFGVLGTYLTLGMGMGRGGDADGDPPPRPVVEEFVPPPPCTMSALPHARPAAPSEAKILGNNFLIDFSLNVHRFYTIKPLRPTGRASSDRRVTGILFK